MQGNNRMTCRIRRAAPSGGSAAIIRIAPTPREILEDLTRLRAARRRPAAPPLIAAFDRAIARLERLARAASFTSAPSRREGGFVNIIDAAGAMTPPAPMAGDAS